MTSKVSKHLESIIIIIAPLGRYGASNIVRTDLDTERKTEEWKEKEKGEGKGREGKRKWKRKRKAK